jgi:hypothetical protein
MLGEKIGEETGMGSSTRVLANPGGGPRLETTFQASGSLLGVSATDTGTYVATMRADGSLFGDGQGIVMGKGGELAAWSAQGVGAPKKDGSVAFRGASYSQSTSPALGAPEPRRRRVRVRIRRAGQH